MFNALVCAGKQLTDNFALIIYTVVGYQKGFVKFQYTDEKIFEYTLHRKKKVGGTIHAYDQEIKK